MSDHIHEHEYVPDSEQILALYRPMLDVAEACADAFLTAVALALQMSDDTATDQNVKMLAGLLIDHILERTRTEGPKPL